LQRIRDAFNANNLVTKPGDIEEDEMIKGGDSKIFPEPEGNKTDIGEDADGDRKK